jgi:hypothetical protein
LSETRLGLAQVILRNPYFLLFLGEFLLATGTSAASVGLAIAVTTSSGNAAISSAIIGLVSVPVLVVSPVTIGLGWLANIYGTIQILFGSISLGLALLLFFRFVLRHRWNSALQDYEASFAA